MMSTFLGSALSISTEYFEKYQDRIMLELGNWNNRLWFRVLNINISNFFVSMMYLIMLQITKLLPINFRGFHFIDFLEYVFTILVASILGTTLSLIIRNIIATGVITGLIVFGLDVNSGLVKTNMHYGGITYILNPLLTSSNMERLIVLLLLYLMGSYAVSMIGKTLFKRTSLIEMAPRRLRSKEFEMVEVRDLAHSRYFWRRLFKLNKDFGVVFAQFATTKSNLFLLPLTTLSFCLLPILGGVRQVNFIGLNVWSPIFVSTIVNAFFAVQIYMGAYGASRSMIQRESLLFKSSRNYILTTLDWNSFFYGLLSILLYSLTMTLMVIFHRGHLELRMFLQGVMTIILLTPVFSLVSLCLVFSNLPIKAYLLIPYMYIFMDTFLGIRFPHLASILPTSLIANLSGGPGLTQLIEKVKMIPIVMLIGIVVLVLLVRFFWFSRSKLLIKISTL